MECSAFFFQFHVGQLNSNYVTTILTLLILPQGSLNKVYQLDSRRKLLHLFFIFVVVFVFVSFFSDRSLMKPLDKSEGKSCVEYTQQPREICKYRHI